MTLTKAILHKKEHRKEYRGAKSIDKSCRNHGSDYWEYENRMHATIKKETIFDIKEKEDFFLTWDPTGDKEYDNAFAEGVLFALDALEEAYHKEKENQDRGD